MKTVMILVLLFFVGCATAPSPPSVLHLYDEIKAGRMNADGVNKASA